MKKNKFIILLCLSAMCFSCGTYFNQPLDIQEARLGEDTKISKSLNNLPLPNEPVVVGVYNFRDQTGQFVPTETGSTFSTAVTQGTTAILLKALEDSKWFVPIERENLNNLLNERNIIRSTRQEYSAANGTQPERLAPLLFAGILLEGGIISYDSNIVTGGLGARYFGVGGSTQYRQDRVTVYLRAVSTSTGEILKTVYVSKTILSQALDASFFRFVNFQRLLEVETGFTRNEPVQLAVTEAIEKSVRSLIIEGIKDGIWTNRKEDQVEVNRLITDYNLETVDAADTKLYDRLYKERRGETAINVALGASLIDGDLGSPRPEIFGRIGYKKFVNPFININGSLNQFNLENEGTFKQDFTSVDFNAEYTVLPFDQLTPFIYAGFGANFANSFSKIDPKIQYGLGLEYLITEGLGINLFAEQNIVFSDELDNVISGKRDDYYYRFGLGLNIYLNPPKTSRKTESLRAKKERRERRLLRDENIKNSREKRKILKSNLTESDKTQSEEGVEKKNNNK
ncbi:hypothetical protein D7030_13125 [Flavobacteriaceae bacterium AU392]|nr:hypothetical protein D1817_05365 [Flavobacteriaceae bacterium]RKM81246.1 hypothetical protein D7030_13125 [Flavobacteriaceae bacterium AU392]